MQENQKSDEKEAAFRQVSEILFEIGIECLMNLWYTNL